MKFYDLYNLLKENADDFSDDSSWEEYLDWEDLETSKIDEFIKKFGVSTEFYLKDNYYLNIRKDGSSYWLEKNNEEYSKIEDSDEDMKNTVLSIPEHTKLELLDITEDDLYISGWESTLGDAKEHPGTVYHYTTEEKWEQIQESGFLNSSRGSGLNNRGAYGIFTSISPETYADGSYGDVMLTIDLQSYKKDYNIEKLEIEPEPDVIEEVINEVFLNKLNLEYESYISADISPETMIVSHTIPIKYISVK